MDFYAQCRIAINTISIYSDSESDPETTLLPKSPLPKRLADQTAKEADNVERNTTQAETVPTSSKEGKN